MNEEEVAERTVVDYVRLGLLIRDWRKAKRWSQESLAREAGLSQKIVSKMEQAESRVLDNLLLVLPPLGKTLIQALSEAGAPLEALGEAGTHPQPAEGQISVRARETALIALQREIERLERQLSECRRGRVLGPGMSEAELDEMERLVRQRRDELAGTDTGHSRGQSGKKPGRGR